MVYQTNAMSPKTSIAMRIPMPASQLTPAASEAMITLNGFTVDAMIPNCEPAKITATGTKRSYPAASRMGTKMG